MCGFFRHLTTISAHFTFIWDFSSFSFSLRLKSALNLSIAARITVSLLIPVSLRTLGIVSRRPSMFSVLIA